MTSRRYSIGFIAQDIHEAVSHEIRDITNLVDTAGDVYSRDWSRLVCIVWGDVKDLQGRDLMLEACL